MIKVHCPVTAVSVLLGHRQILGIEGRGPDHGPAGVLVRPRGLTPAPRPHRPDTDRSRGVSRPPSAPSPWESIWLPRSASVPTARRDTVARPGFDGAMDLADALDFARTTRRSVMATTRNGRPQLSNVLHLVSDDGVIRISTTVARAKHRKLARDPWAALHVTQDDFWAYRVLEGAVELSPIIASVEDPGVDEHVEHYRLVVREHEDWDAFRGSLVAERRSILRLVPFRATAWPRCPRPTTGEAP